MLTNKKLPCSLHQTGHKGPQSNL